LEEKLEQGRTMNKEVKKQTNIEEAYKRRWPSFVPTTTGDRVGDIAPFLPT